MAPRLLNFLCCMIENYNSVQEFLEVIIMEEDDRKVAKNSMVVPV